MFMDACWFGGRPPRTLSELSTSGLTFTTSEQEKRGCPSGLSASLPSGPLEALADTEPAARASVLGNVVGL